MDNILLANTGVVRIPKNIVFIRNNKEYLAPTLTKSGNITKRNKKKVINFEYSKDPNSFLIIENKGETLNTLKKANKIKEIDNESKILSSKIRNLLDEMENLNKNTNKYKELKKKYSELSNTKNELFYNKRELLGLERMPSWF